MRNGLLGVTATCILASAAQAQMPVHVPEKDPNCDRACLEGFVDRYLAAMLEQNVGDDLFARDVKFTENGIQLPLGNEGLWWGMSGLGGYRFYVPDLETQQIAFLGTVVENMGNGGVNDGQGNNVGISLRLKIRDGLITEVEQLVSRPEVQLGGGGGGGGRAGGAGRAGGGGAAAGAGGAGRAGGGGAGDAGRAGGAAGAGRAGGAGAGGGGPFGGTTGDRVAAMGEPHPIWRETIPENERHTREELIQAGNHYFTALARHDSQGYYPFTTDCERYENGSLSTADCLANFTGNSLNGIVDRIRDRRFVAADTERGVVFAFAFFDHYRINWTWQLAEIFKIENGQIRRVEALFHQAPFGISSGWSPYDLSISEAIQSIR